MRIALAGDHAGFEMKRDLAPKLRAHGHEVLDLGTHSTDAVDYPDCAVAVAAAEFGTCAVLAVTCSTDAAISLTAETVSSPERVSDST